MARIHLPLIVLLICAAPANAQEPPPPGSNSTGSCFVATDDMTWSAVGLNEEQLGRVKSLQTACKTDCAITPESRKTHADISGAVLKRYEEELRAMLSPEQWAKWSEWCAARPNRM